MSNHPNRRRGNPAANPTPKQIRDARESAGLTLSAAAALVHSNLRSWQKWEAGDRSMHPAFFELFTLKSNMENYADNARIEATRPSLSQKREPNMPNTDNLERTKGDAVASNDQLGEFVHPLEHIAWKLIDEKRCAIDVWDLASALGRPCFKPENKAYDLVAADVLEVMFQSGRAKRTGNGNPKKPELANFFYSRA